jgi:hypothetical protein
MSLLLFYFLRIKDLLIFVGQGVLQEFELGTLSLPGKLFTTWAMPLAQDLLILF